jgi:predicted RNA-binding protein with RPS1 domain
MYPHGPYEIFPRCLVVDIPRQGRYLLAIGTERCHPMATDEKQKGRDKKKKGWFARFLERIARESEKSGGRICPS